MKKLLAIVLACAMAVMAFASVATAEETKDSYTVGLNYFGPGSYALLSLKDNSEYVINYMGDTPQAVSDNFTVEQIVADVENLCNAGCDGIIIWLPVDQLYTTVGDICARFEVPFVLNDKIPTDPEILAALQENPYYIGAVAPANAVYGELIAEYAIAQGYKTCIAAMSAVGDPTDTPRLEAFTAAFEAAGGEVLDVLNCENITDGTSKIENSLMANFDVDFIYGVGSDFGIAAVTALENQQIDDIAILTSGLDSEALKYEEEGKIELINGDFWVAGYFAAVIMEAYLHGNQMLDAEGNVPYIDNILPFEVPAEQFALYKKVFLDNHCYSQEETEALVNGTYEDLLAALAAYSIEERALAKFERGEIEAADLEAAGISVE